MGKFVSVDVIWLLIGAFMVFSMQPGFAMVEAGFCRAKNAGNIIMKNFVDMALGSIFFWIIGFSLMFGQDIGGFIGSPDLFTTGNYGTDTYPSPVWFVFQTMFCATSATIVSGAVAERTNFAVYCIYSVLISMVVYPISGHWIWGGGWLAQMGFHDFAGSTAVHMVGGIAALLGAWMMGPRIGKYNEDGSVNAIPGHSIPLGGLGVFLLWFGWFGFNGCSTAAATGDEVLTSMGTIFITTNIAAAGGLVSSMLYTWFRYGKPDVSMSLNGVLAGLVAITAGCDCVSVGSALVIGLIAGIAVVLSVEFIDKKLKIDDPCGAVSVHGLCGALGTLLTGVFATKNGLIAGQTHLFVTQVIGVAAVALYAAIFMFCIYKVLDLTIGLRVGAKEELAGLDVEEHGLYSAYADFVPTPELAQTIPASMEMSSLEAKLAAENAVANLTPAENTLTPAPVKEHHGPKMSKVVIITSQGRFEPLKMALEILGVTGMTVTKVLGFGIQRGSTEKYRGVEVAARLLPKVKIELIVSKIPVETVVQTAKRALYTGKYGDGKIFVYDVEDVVKIRTGESGYAALQDKPMLEAD